MRPIRDNPGADLRMISDITDLSDDDIFVSMRALIRDGAVRTDGDNHYWLI